MKGLVGFFFLQFNRITATCAQIIFWDVGLGFGALGCVALCRTRYIRVLPRPTRRLKTREKPRGGGRQLWILCVFVV